LLLANPTRIDLSRTVFNTEAHPLEIVPYSPAAKP
jgi:hypothetical protein